MAQQDTSAAADSSPPAEMTQAQAKRAARSADASELGEVHLAELRHSEGPRAQVLSELRARAQKSDDALAQETTGEHYMLSDVEHAAAVFDTSPAMARAVFAYTLRSRLNEGEFRAALEAVQAREV